MTFKALKRMVPICSRETSCFGANFPPPTPSTIPRFAAFNISGFVISVKLELPACAFSVVLMCLQTCIYNLSFTLTQYKRFFYWPAFRSLEKKSLTSRVDGSGSPDVNKVVSTNLRIIRESKNLSPDQAAKMTEVSKSMLGQIERGETNPTITVFRFCPFMVPSERGPASCHPPWLLLAWCFPPWPLLAWCLPPRPDIAYLIDSTMNYAYNENNRIWQMKWRLLLEIMDTR